MWTESRGILHPWNLFPYGGTPWWQPEPECPPSYVGGEAGDVEGIGHDASCYSIWDGPVENEVDSKCVGLSPKPFDNVVQQMADLNAELCIWLYGEGIGASVDHDIVELFDDGLVRNDGLVDAYLDSKLDGQTDEWYADALDDLRFRVAKSIFCFEDFARWKNRDYNDDDAILAVEERFKYGRMAKTPEGWTYMEDDSSDRDEEDYREMRINRLGHVFTFERKDFWQRCRNAPDELRRALTSFAVQHPPLQNTSDLTWKVFEDFFIAHASVAYAWQEHYSDDNDEDSLMTLIGLIRRLVDVSS
jgi:hypothetical protein